MIVNFNLLLMYAKQNWRMFYLNVLYRVLGNIL